MRKYWLAVLLIGGLLAWGLSWDAPASAELTEDAPEWATPAEGFAKKVAGTYLTTFWFTECVDWIDGGGEGCQEGIYEPACDECIQEVYNTSGSALMTIHSDGTFITWSENAYGVLGAAPEARRHDSPSIGTWERSGSREMKGTGFIIGKKEQDATNAFIVRQNLTVTFSADFNDMEIDLPVQLVFPAGVDGDGDGVDDGYECLYWAGEEGAEAPDPDTTACPWLNVYAGGATGTRVHPHAGVE